MVCVLGRQASLGLGWGEKGHEGRKWMARKRLILTSCLSEPLLPSATRTRAPPASPTQHKQQQQQQQAGGPTPSCSGVPVLLASFGGGRVCTRVPPRASSRARPLYGQPSRKSGCGFSQERVRILPTKGNQKKTSTVLLSFSLFFPVS